MGGTSEVRIVISAKNLATRAFKTTTSAVNKLKGAVFSLKTAFLALVGAAGLGAVIKNLIQVGSSFEKLGLQLEAVQGSASAGRKALEWVKDFAAKTSLSLRQVTAGFVKMRAFGLDPMDGSMQAIVDQTAKLAGGQREMGNIILAVGQMWTEQKVRGQEVRQLMQTAVPVYQLLAAANNTTAKKMKEMAQAGELGAEAVRQLITEMGKAASGSAFILMQAFTGLWSNFNDELDKSKDTFTRAKGGLLDFVKSALNVGIKRLKILRESGKLEEFGREFGKSLASATISIGTFVNSLRELQITLLETKIIALDFSGAFGNVFGTRSDKELKVILADINFFKQKVIDLRAEITATEGFFKKLASDIVAGIGVVPKSLPKTAGSDGDDNGAAERDAKIKAKQLLAQDKFNIFMAQKKLIRLTQAREIQDKADAEELAIEQQVMSVQISNAISNGTRLEEINRLVAESSLLLKDKTLKKLANMSAAAVADEIRSLEKTAADELVIEQQVMSVQISNAISNMSRLEEINRLVANSSLTLKDETLKKLAEMSIKDAANIIQLLEKTAADELALQTLKDDTQIENAILHTERLMAIDQLIAESRLILKQETLDKLAEMDLSAAEREIALRTRAANNVTAIQERSGRAAVAGAFQIGAAIAGASKANAITMLAISKAAAIANIIVNTQQAMSVAAAQLGPASGPVEAAIFTAGLQKIAIVTATGIAQGIGLNRSSSGGGVGGADTGGTLQDFSDPQDQQGRINITLNIEVRDPESLPGFDWDAVIEPIAESLGNHVDRGGATGDVQFVVSTRGD